MAVRSEFSGAVGAETGEDSIAEFREDRLAHSGNVKGIVTTYSQPKKLAVTGPAAGSECLQLAQSKVIAVSVEAHNERAANTGSSRGPVILK